MGHRCWQEGEGTLRCPELGNSASPSTALPIPVFSSPCHAPQFPVLLNSGLLTTLGLCSNSQFTFPVPCPARLWSYFLPCLLSSSTTLCLHPSTWFSLVRPSSSLSSGQGEHHCCRSSGLPWCTEMQTGSLAPGCCMPSARKRTLRCSSKSVLGRSKHLFLWPDLGEEGNFHRDITRQTAYISAQFLLQSRMLLALLTQLVLCQQTTHFPLLVPFTETSELFGRRFSQCACQWVIHSEAKVRSEKNLCRREGWQICKQLK